MISIPSNLQTNKYLFIIHTLADVKIFAIEFNKNNLSRFHLKSIAQSLSIKLNFSGTDFLVMVTNMKAYLKFIHS